MMGLKEKAFSHDSRVYTTHIGDVPEVPDYDEEGTFYCRALQNLLFIRLLLSRAAEAADFSNT